MSSTPSLSASAPAGPTFPFFQLPPEVQLMVYTLYFDHWNLFFGPLPRSTHPHRQSTQLHGVDGPPHLDILRVSRHVSLEAMKCFRRSFTGVITFGGKSCQGLDELQKKYDIGWVYQAITMIRFNNVNTRASPTISLPQMSYGMCTNLRTIHVCSVWPPHPQFDMLSKNQILSGSQDALAYAEGADFQSCLRELPFLFRDVRIVKRTYLEVVNQNNKNKYGCVAIDYEFRKDSMAIVSRKYIRREKFIRFGKDNEIIAH